MQSFIKKNFPAFLLLMLFYSSKAADTTHTPLRIAVLLPLNLDSAFTGDEYNLSNSKIPQYFLSGLDFYSGVMMAVDSLQKENANIEVWIFDTHKQHQSTQQLAAQLQSLNLSLIIASISNSSEQKTISEFSARNSVPVISATFPNDANLINNPFFIMINPTWQTHVNAIYNYLAKNYSTKKIILFTRKGALEDRIAQILQKLNTKRLINLSTVVLSDNFSDADVLKHLDSANQNLILCGSLYENFGKALIKTLNDNGLSYSTVLVGMPTWSGMSDLFGNSSGNLQVVITTPYNYLRTNSNLQSVSDIYKASYYSRPSDMVFKGYETMYHFTKLLLTHQDAFINNASDTAHKISDDYNFQPVRLANTSFVPDYLENKKLYYIKIVNGKIQLIE